MSQLYSSPPDVGLLIFDPEGEYALPDTQGRPGLVNVPALRKRISLYTNRKVDPQHADVVKGSVLGGFWRLPAAGHRGRLHAAGKAGHGFRQPVAEHGVETLEATGGAAGR